VEETLDVFLEEILEKLLEVFFLEKMLKECNLKNSWRELWKYFTRNPFKYFSV